MSNQRPNAVTTAPPMLGVGNTLGSGRAPAGATDLVKKVANRERLLGASLGMAIARPPAGPLASKAMVATVLPGKFAGVTPLPKYVGAIRPIQHGLSPRPLLL